MEDSVRNRIAVIARNAIQEIDRIAEIVSVNGSSSTSRAVSNDSRNALTELRRRFPTLSSSAGGVGRGASGSGASGSGARRSGNVGRPSRFSSIKDIINVGAQVDKTPLGRYEKLKLERQNRIITGFAFDKRWNESILYEKVKKQFPEDCRNIDFEFVKNVGGMLVVPTLPSGVKIDCNILIKSIASAGAVYVRLFADDLDDIEDTVLDTSPFEIFNPVSDAVNVQEEVTDPPGEVIDVSDDDAEVKERGICELVQEIIKECEQCQNPTEILKYAQDKILTGRQLDITDLESEISGETNFILVDRESLLETGLDEISNLVNLRLPVEVNFTGEAARDYGGPRKEFFRLMLIEIKEKYFDGGLREDLAEKYKIVGIVMGLSVLQNGKIPQFIPEDMLQEIVQGPSSSPCISNLQKGLSKVGILQLMMNLPPFLYLFRPSDASSLNVKKLTHLLTPSFDEEGSNSRKHQKDVHNAFVRYIREVHAGRREMGSVTITLGHILQFVCGTDEEPVLGFARSPEIRFVQFQESFIPTANTCINVLNLPYPTVMNRLPSDDDLFKLYDHAFVSLYFGIV